MSEKSTTRFELWKMDAGHAFFEVTNESARRLLQPGARLVWSVEATSWHEARARMHEHLGWEPYKPSKPAAPAGEKRVDEVRGGPFARPPLEPT